MEIGNRAQWSGSDINVDSSGVHDELDRALATAPASLFDRDHAHIIAGRADGDGTLFTAQRPIDRRLRLGRYVAASPAAGDLPAHHRLHRDERFLPLATVNRFNRLADASPTETASTTASPSVSTPATRWNGRPFS